MIRRLALRFVAAILAGLTILTGAWLAIFGLPLTAAWTLLAAVVPFRAALGRAGRRDVWGAALLGGVGLLGLPLSYGELADRLDALAAAKDARGAEAFGPRDQVGVYGLHLVVAAGGYAWGFPEISDETLGMLLPRDGGVDRDSDFAMRSPKVRRAVAAMMEEAVAGGVPAGRKVGWRGYGQADESMRVALALNAPLFLEATPRDTDEGLVLDVVGTAWMAYPRTSKLPLLDVGGRALVFDEGLLWVLQEQGLLHAYSMRWRWTVPADDPRLEDLASPVADLRERALVAL